MLILIGAIVVFALIMAVGVANGRQKEMIERRKAVSKRWPTDELYVSAANGSVVGINFREQSVILGAKGREKAYSFAQIVAVEVTQNGSVVSQTNRGSQLAGAAIGGLAFGGVGALIGGLSGSARVTQKIKTITLKVTVDDNYDPIHSVVFLQLAGDGRDPDDKLLVKPARDAAERVHAHLLGAMRKGHTALQATTMATLAPAVSTEQLTKLWDMRQAGGLTEEEFQQQKARLLAAPAAPPSLPQPRDPGRRYGVILLDYGPNRVACAKAVIDEVPELATARTAFQKITLPLELLRNVGETRARKVQAALEAVGAKVDVV